MNYINRLQAEVQAYKDGLDELEAYLASDKFSGSGNQFVSTHDVVARIATTRANVGIAQDGNYLVRS